MTRQLDQQRQVLVDQTGAAQRLRGGHLDGKRYLVGCQLQQLYQRLFGQHASSINTMANQDRPMGFPGDKEAAKRANRDQPETTITPGRSPF